MAHRQSPSTLPPLTTHNMNLSSMIHTALPHHSALPSPSSASLHPNEWPSVSQFRPQCQTQQLFPSPSTLTSTPLPKLPPLTSQLAQPTYQHRPLSSIHSVFPYSPSDRNLSHQPQPHSVLATDPTSYPLPSRVNHHTKFPPSRLHDTSPLVSRSDRIAPLSLPLPATKSIYSDPHPVPYDIAAQPTVSPVSVAQTNDTNYCVSPVSTSQPADYALPTAQSAMHSDTQRVSAIDDSLIERLRGFNGPHPPAGPPVFAISRGEPQIRDTSESLAIGYVDNVPGRDLGQLASQTDAVTVSPDRPHACRKCSATFRRRDNLMAHIRAQHKGERPFKCEVCGFRFIKKDHAMKHWKVVHLKERPFVCTRCNSRFGQRSDLNKHVRSVHLRIKPFECEHCGLRFSHRGNQIRHQAVVHEKKKPFTCTECSSSFAEKSNLLKHCQAVHKNGAAFSS